MLRLNKPTEQPPKSANLNMEGLGDIFRVNESRFFIQQAKNREFLWHERLTMSICLCLAIFPNKPLMLRLKIHMRFAKLRMLVCQFRVFSLCRLILLTERRDKVFYRGGICPAINKLFQGFERFRKFHRVNRPKNQSQTQVCYSPKPVHFHRPES